MTPRIKLTVRLLLSPAGPHLLVQTHHWPSFGHNGQICENQMTRALCKKMAIAAADVHKNVGGAFNDGMCTIFLNVLLIIYKKISRL